MSFEQVAASYKAVLSDAVDNHHAAIGAGKLWIFSRKYVDQKEFNWGHRVHYVGGYAIEYDTNTNAYGDPIEVPPLSDLENAEEMIFTHKGNVYLLLTSAFGAAFFRSIHRWNGAKWDKIVDFPEPSEKSEDTAHIYWAIANGDHNNAIFIMSATSGEVLKVHRMTIQDDMAEISHFTDVPQEINRLRGRPVGGVVAAGKLYISIGVQGCGFRWEAQRFLVVDLASKESDESYIEGEYDTMPTFCFSGPLIKAVSKDGDWLTIAGTTQVGMCNSKFNDEIWSLTGLGGQLAWKKHDLRIPETFTNECFGAYDEYEGKLVIVGETAVGVAKF